MDAFGKLEVHRQAFGEPLKALRDLQEQKASLVVDDQTYLRELELLRHQVREISQAQLSPEQAQELETQYERHLHAAKLLELSQGLLHLLNEQEGSLWDLIGTIGRNLDQIRSLDAATQSMEGIHQELANQVSELEQAHPITLTDWIWILLSCRNSKSRWPRYNPSSANMDPK